jgi:ribosomal protein S8
LSLVFENPLFKKKIMSFTSEIADFLSRIRVAYLSKDLSVRLRLCKTTLQLSSIFYRQGLIQSFSVADSRTIIFRLKYKNNRPLINQLQIVSTPGRRVYWNCRQIALQLNKHSIGTIYILSTPAGLRTHGECLASTSGGGEVLLKLNIT